MILRLRGRSVLGSTFNDVLSRYAKALKDAESKLVLVSATENAREQLAATGVTDIVGSDNIYTSDEWVGATTKRAYRDGAVWIRTHANDRDGDD